MHDLIEITPLGNPAPISESFGPVTLTEVVDVALASVAARHERTAETIAALQAFLGVSPPKPGHWAGDLRTAFWIGPEQWMIEAPMQTHLDLTTQLTALTDRAMSVTMQTDGWCRFDLTGARLPDVMERLCDVNLRAFQGGEAQRTTIHHLGCFVICRTPTHLSVIGPRASAESLHHALQTALRSVF